MLSSRQNRRLNPNRRTPRQGHLDEALNIVVAYLDKIKNSKLVMKSAPADGLPQGREAQQQVHQGCRLVRVLR